MITVLNHQPVKAIDYSMIADGIRAFLMDTDMPLADKAPPTKVKVHSDFPPKVHGDFPRVEFNAGDFKMRCFATRESIAALADRIAKHGVKEKKEKDYTLRTAHGQEYDGQLNLILMDKGGKYKYVDLYIDGKRLEGDFIVAKSNVARNGYIILACGAGSPLKVSRAKNVSEALRHTTEAINKASFEKVSRAIAQRKVAHAAKLLECGL